MDAVEYTMAYPLVAPFATFLEVNAISSFTNVNGNTTFKKVIRIHATYSDVLLFNVYGNEAMYMIMGIIKLPSFKSICLVTSSTIFCNSFLVGAFVPCCIFCNVSLKVSRFIVLLFNLSIESFIVFFAVSIPVLVLIIYSFIYYQYYFISIRT